MPITQEIILNQSSPVRMLAHGFYYKQSYLFVRTNRCIYSVAKEEILYLKAESNYTRIVLLTGKYILDSKPLKHYCGVLGISFIRPHQSFLVNFRHVKLVCLQNGGDLVLHNQMVIPIAKSRKPFILNFFKN